MSFVVEDGTGKSDATSYSSIADLKSYWDDVGYDYSSLSDDDVEQLLVKASQTVDGQYYRRFPGFRKKGDQGLEWPRYDAEYQDGYTIQSNEVPPEIKKAVYEMAYIKNSGTTIQPEIDGGGVLQSHSVTAGPVSESKTFRPGSGSGRSKFTTVSDILVRIIGPGTYLKLKRV